MLHDNASCNFLYNELGTINGTEFVELKKRILKKNNTTTTTPKNQQTNAKLFISSQPCKPPLTTYLLSLEETSIDNLNLSAFAFQVANEFQHSAAKLNDDGQTFQCPHCITE